MGLELYWWSVHITSWAQADIMSYISVSYFLFCQLAHNRPCDSVTAHTWHDLEFKNLSGLVFKKKIAIHIWSFIQFSYVLVWRKTLTWTWGWSQHLPFKSSYIFTWRKEENTQKAIMLHVSNIQTACTNAGLVRKVESCVQWPVRVQRPLSAQANHPLRITSKSLLVLSQMLSQQRELLGAQITHTVL